MGVYRSPTPTDNFITTTEQTDGASFWESFRFPKGWAGWLLSVHTRPLVLVTADNVARLTSLIYFHHYIASSAEIRPPVWNSFLKSKKEMKKEKKKSQFCVTVSHTDSSGGAAIDFRINRKWREMGWKWLGIGQAGKVSGAAGVSVQHVFLSVCVSNVNVKVFRSWTLFFYFVPFFLNFWFILLDSFTLSEETFLTCLWISSHYKWTGESINTDSI